MKGFTSPLWPIRYKPLPDELLSCWIVRLAYGHGLKVQTFCNQIFGEYRQIWNRDIDRLAQPWLLEELSYRTGTDLVRVRNTTLRSYEGLLYPKFRSAGALTWVLVQRMYHRKRNAFGMQFCPRCLAEDVIPYYRKSWRVALNTICVQHEIMLHDRCPHCGGPVMFHRLDMLDLDFVDEKYLSYCAACGFDLRQAHKNKPKFYDADAGNLLRHLNSEIQKHGASNSRIELGFYSVMRHLCRMMTANYSHLHLRDFIIDQLGISDIPLQDHRIPFETRSLEERHHLLQLTAWLMVDVEARLEQAWRARAIRYNLFLKDLPDPPEWYRTITAKFSNWRAM